MATRVGLHSDRIFDPPGKRQLAAEVMERVLPKGRSALEHLPSLEDQVVRQQSGRRHTGLRLGLGPVSFVAVVSIMLLAVPMAAQGPTDTRFCRVEAAPANQPAADIGGIRVSGQAVMERADTDEMYFIDILFFYTDSFADDFTRRGRSMSDEIRQSVSLANAALANSKVNATVRIVGVEQLPGVPDVRTWRST